MPIVQGIATFLKSIFQHKLRMFIFASSVPIFMILLFPYGDLSGYISGLIRQSTRNTVYFAFKDMRVGLLPRLSIQLDDLRVSAKQIPEIKIRELTVKPQITNILNKGVDLEVRDLWGAHADISFHESAFKEDKNLRLHNVDVNFSKLSLQKLMNNMVPEVSIKGVARGKVTTAVESTFARAPEADIQASVRNFMFLSSMVKTPMGPLVIPSIQWETVVLKGRLDQEGMVIEQAQLGQQKEPFRGRLKGRIKLEWRRTSRGLKPIARTYDLKLELYATKAKQKSLSLFLGFIDDYKKKQGAGYRYLVRLKGRGGGPPQFSVLNKF